jgi:hypothetical protein
MDATQLLAMAEALVQDPGWWVGFPYFLEECEDIPDLNQDVLVRLQTKVDGFIANRFTPPHGGQVEFEDDEVPFLGGFLIYKHSRRSLN